MASPCGARLCKTEEVRRWLGKATAWLDQYRDGMPARTEEDLGLHLHNWLEAHVLRREAEGADSAGGTTVNLGFVFAKQIRCSADARNYKAASPYAKKLGRQT